jgi:hypothetical protein
MISSIIIGTSLLVSQIGNAAEPKLVETGLVEGGYRIVAVTETTSASFQSGKPLQFGAYHLIPETAELSIKNNANKNAVRFEIIDFYAVQGDFEKVQARPQQVQEDFSKLAQSFKLTSSEKLRQWLIEIDQRDLDARIQIQDRRDPSLKLFETSVKDVLDFEKFDNALTLFFQAAQKKRKPFSFSVYVKNPHTLDASLFINQDVLYASVESGAGVRSQKEVRVELPSVLNWDRNLSRYNRSVTFYEAYKKLDEMLIPYLQKGVALDSFEQVSDSVWRRQLLNAAFEVFYSDPTLSTSNVCDGYLVQNKGQDASGSAMIKFSVFEEKALSIPLRAGSIQEF